MGTPFPKEELYVIDEIVKMFSQPVLRGDIDLLAKVWQDEDARKNRLLAELDVDVAELQSADKFTLLLEEEGIEVETKDGKHGPIPAFAKTDQFMRDLLEHENDRVRTLAEARLGVKSTFLQTRAETLGWMARRGPLAVYLRYAGAGTLRVSGGDGGNWLNFKRNSDIRRAVLAPEGHFIAPVDASQIECRVLHYLAGGADEPVIQKFRNNEDPYVDLASEFYKEPIYKPEKGDPRRAEMEAKRGMGKQGRLMCLGPSTEVLTDRGIKAILDVTTYDRLWDGIEWVEHQGLIFQGVRDVENFAGVEMTSDHPVLCGPQHWLPASQLQNESTLCRALAVGSANLPSQALKWAKKAVWSKLLCAVRARLQSIRLTLQTCTQDDQPDALSAQENLAVFGSKNIMDMPMSAPNRVIAPAFWDVYPRSMGAATSAQNIRTLMTTEDVASAFFTVGEMIAAPFSHIWSRFQGGITRHFRSIASKTTRGTSLATCASLQPSSKPTIDAACGTSKRKSSVFDLAFAGPRNRFTILSNRGPLIVHNCGYGAAGKQFKITAKNGLYGPPVDIPIEEADRFVKLYRETNPSICGRVRGYWAQCEHMLKVLANGSTLEVGPLLIHMHKLYVGDSRIPMNYDTLEWYRPTADDAHLYRDFERNGFYRMKTRQGWKKMWGSKLTQNICEAVSRVIVSQALIRIKRQFGIRALNWPYDELLLLIPRDGHEHQHLQQCKAEMSRTPEWLPGLPLACDGELGERYDK